MGQEEIIANFELRISNLRKHKANWRLNGETTDAEMRRRGETKIRGKRSLGRGQIAKCEMMVGYAWRSLSFFLR